MKKAYCMSLLLEWGWPKKSAFFWRRREKMGERIKTHFQYYDNALFCKSKIECIVLNSHTESYTNSLFLLQKYNEESQFKKNCNAVKRKISTTLLNQKKFIGSHVFNIELGTNKWENNPFSKAHCMSLLLEWGWPKKSAFFWGRRQQGKMGKRIKTHFKYYHNALFVKLK